MHRTLHDPPCPTLLLVLPKPANTLATPACAPCRCPSSHLTCLPRHHTSQPSPHLTLPFPSPFTLTLALAPPPQGPEIRTGFLENEQPVVLQAGAELTISTDYALKGNKDMITMSYGKLAQVRWRVCV